MRQRWGFGSKALLLVGSLLTVAGCGDLLGAPPDFGVSLNPQTVELQPGGTTETDLTVTPFGGFSGTVSVNLEGAPQGVTVSPTSFNVKADGSTTQKLTLTATPTVPVGNYTVQVRVSHSGTGLEKKATLLLNVRTGSTQPSQSFTLNVDPTNVQIVEQGSTNLNVTITPQNGFSGAVNLSLKNLDGSTATQFQLNPATVQVSGSSPVSAQVALSASSASPGTYNLKLVATSGNTSREVSLTVQVTPAPSFSISLSSNSLTVRPGENSNLTLVVVPQNGFAGTVNISLLDAFTNVPFAHATVSPSSYSISGNDPVIIHLTVQVLPSAPLGNYPLKVSVSSSNKTKQTDLTLTVQAPPSFTIGASPSNLSLVAGSSTSISIAIAPLNGFSGNVSLSVTDQNGTPVSGFNITVPTGSVNVSSDQVAIASATLAVSNTVAPGNYSLKIKGTSGNITATTDIMVSVSGFSFILTPTSVTLSGGQGTTTAFISSLNGFSGTVSFSLVDAQGQPFPAFSLNYTPTSVDPNNPYAAINLTITDPTGLPQGTYNLYVKAQHGNLAKYQPISITVP